VARHKSAVKAHEQSEAQRDRNRRLRSTLRSTLKKIRTSLDRGEVEPAAASLASTCSVIDRMVAKGVLHRNAAGRYKSRLAHRLTKLTASS